MSYKWSANWIKAAEDMSEKVPVFAKEFPIDKEVLNAKLYIAVMGVYEAQLNGKRVGEFIMAPGWTSYDTRLQYQEYDVAELLEADNQLTVTVGPGWYRGRGVGRAKEVPFGILAELKITYTDGTTDVILTDESWKVAESQVRFSEIYDGEIYDATYESVFDGATEVFEGLSDSLIPQEGEIVKEQEHVAAARMFRTPKGEVIVDFGQEVTGYVVTTVEAKAGEMVDLSFAEVLDGEGNFYTANYRSAKALYQYTCRDGKQTYKPKLTFWGFRYVRVNQFPGGLDHVALSNFTAVVLHSEIKRTGYLNCSNPLLNRLFSNIIWGQKSNFLDIPTDCPQRDERLGWTGDAQVFVRTASLNYDVEKFFAKWLKDVAAEQAENGAIPRFVPMRQVDTPMGITAWGDACVICPWELYKNYGNTKILEDQFDSMKKWIGYITNVTKTPYLWTGSDHYGDWLALDAPYGSYKGSSRFDFIASAFYAYSTSLVIKIGKIIGEDVAYFEDLYQKIVETFRATFTEYTTQTECILAAHFHLAPEPQKAADKLAEMVTNCGVQLQTGFVGTPYLLHVLSNFGYTELAYSLLLREEFPSWLYPVTKGATTIWEHWDGIRDDGTFWSDAMNSYNHYAYGSVADWVYGVAAGIQPVEEAPGFAKVTIAPVPDKRLDWLKAVLDTRHGRIISEWRQEKDFWRYEITTPVEAVITIAGHVYEVQPGTYYYYSEIK